MLSTWMLCWLLDWWRLIGCGGKNFLTKQMGSFKWRGRETYGYDPSKHNDSLHFYKNTWACQMSTIKFHKIDALFEVIQLVLVIINPFHATGLFLFPLKTSKNLWFPDVFKMYNKRPVAWYGLMKVLKVMQRANFFFPRHFRLLFKEFKKLYFSLYYGKPWTLSLSFFRTCVPCWIAK